MINSLPFCLLFKTRWLIEMVRNLLQASVLRTWETAITILALMTERSYFIIIADLTFKSPNPLCRTGSSRMAPVVVVVAIDRRTKIGVPQLRLKEQVHFLENNSASRLIE